VPRQLIGMVLLLLSAPVACPEGRFGRRVLKPVEPGKYELRTVDDLQAPLLRAKAYTISSLAYHDSARLYVEVWISNRSQSELRIPKDFINVENAGRTLARTNTIKAAEEIEAASIRPFVPDATGKDPRTNEPVYDRAEVDQQARRHIEQQERENTFATLLLTLAQENAAAALAPSQDRVIAYTFEHLKDPGLPVTIRVRIGGEECVFVLKDPPPEKKSEGGKQA
jgi:hypothetical protein